MASPHRLLMFNNIIQNLASQTHLDIRTPEYSKDILSKLYTAASWLWQQHLGEHNGRKYWTSLQVTKTGCAKYFKGRFYIMFDRLEWLSVPTRLMYNKAVLTYIALNNLAPAYISGLLKPVSETHTRSLRSSKNGLLSVPRSRTALYDRSFSYSASKLWNALPQSIRTKPSLKSFKTSLKAQFQT